MTRALQNSLTFDVTFKVYDYTESYGEYINDNVYGVSHNNSIKEILSNHEAVRRAECDERYK